MTGPVFLGSREYFGCNYSLSLSLSPLALSLSLGAAWELVAVM